MTAPASNFTALLERVRELLEDGRGVAEAKTIARNRFRLSAGREALEQSPEVGTSIPTFETLIEEQSQPREPHSDLDGHWLVGLVVTIEVAYQVAGGDALPFPTGGARAHVSASAHNDGLDIRAVLTWPENLTATEAAIPTGVCGGGLTWVRCRTRFEPGKLIASHVFRCDAWVSRPT